MYLSREEVSKNGRQPFSLVVLESTPGEQMELKEKKKKEKRGVWEGMRCWREKRSPATKTGLRWMGG